MLTAVDSECRASMVEAETRERAKAKAEWVDSLADMQRSYNTTVLPFIASMQAVHSQQVRSRIQAHAFAPAFAHAFAPIALIWYECKCVVCVDMRCMYGHTCKYV